MNKLPSSTIITRLCWGVFFLALLFLAFQVMPCALGQRDAASKTSYGVPTSLVGGSQATPRGVLTPTPTPTPCGSKIYNIAGADDSALTNTTRIYDIATNTWATGAPIPEPNGLTSHATAYFNGKIYVAGGYNGFALINTVRAYDIATDTWSTLAPLPQAVVVPGFGIINGKLYIAGGGDLFGELNTLYVYDTATNMWTTGPNLPTGVDGPGSAVYQGKLYLFGGAVFLGGIPFPITATQIFDPVANSWSTGPSMNVGRLWFYGAAIDDSSIVAPGGVDASLLSTNDNEQLTATWAIKAPLPYSAEGPFAVSDGTFVYIGGGLEDSAGVHRDTLRYDPVANTYTPLAPAPDAHYLSQAVIVSISCGGELTLVSAASRKSHGNAGPFDIDLPLTGTPGVECRVGNGGTFLQTIVFTFSEDVTSISGASTTTCGSVMSTTFSGNTVTVQLGNVNCDGSDITVSVAGVNGASGSVDASATMTLQVADVNADGVVDTADINEIRRHIGRGLVHDGNFRDDITVDGHINHGDKTLAKTKL